MNARAGRGKKNIDYKSWNESPLWDNMGPTKKVEKLELIPTNDPPQAKAMLIQFEKKFTEGDETVTRLIDFTVNLETKSEETAKALRDGYRVDLDKLLEVFNVNKEEKENG